MARATMADLISRVRRLIGDRAGAIQQFSDDEIQQTLDRHRTDVWFEELETNGYPSWTVWYSELEAWEQGASFTDASRNPATPSEVDSDYPGGRFAFSAAQTNGVYATGATYDLVAAALELVEEWIALLKGEFDFTTDGDTFRRSQRLENLTKLAGSLKRRRPPRCAKRES